MANAADYFGSGVIAPRQPNENLLTYGPRALLEMPARALFAVGADAGKAGAAAYNTYTSTPAGDTNAALKARMDTARQAGGGAFPKSYQDPIWDSLEQQYGGAEAPLLKAVRLNGEKSNSDQVNPTTGATTPYQITASTRQLIQSKYKFDPWSSPENAVKGAAIVLRDHGGASNPQAAIGGYFGGAAGAANPFSSATDAGGMSIGQYVQNVMGGSDGKGLANGFDPSYANAAMGELNKAQQAAKTPFTYGFDGAGPMPAQPKSEPSPKTDFSQVDADLQAMKPVEMTLKEQKQVQWKDFWSGIGNAMASTHDGESLGTLFMRIGGGALAGKGAAMDEVQQRKSEFDDKMSRWQAALYTHDAQKAQIAQGEAMVDWKANSDWADNNWKLAVDQWRSNSNVSLQGNTLVQQIVDPNTGHVTIHGLPIASAVDAEFARLKAGVFGSMFSTQNDQTQATANLENQVTGKLALGAAAQQMMSSSASPQDKAAAAAYGVANIATFATTSGLVPQAVGQDAAKDIYKEVQQDLTARGMFPGQTGYAEAFNKGVSVRVAQMAVAAPTVMQNLTNLGPAAAMFDQQPDKSTVQTKTDQFGRQTTTATDVFSGNQ